MNQCPICKQTKPAKPVTTKQLQQLAEVDLEVLGSRTEREYQKAKPFARHYLKILNRSKGRLLRIHAELYLRQKKRRQAS